MNLYAVVANNAVNKTDFLGLLVDSVTKNPTVAVDAEAALYGDPVVIDLTKPVSAGLFTKIVQFFCKKDCTDDAGATCDCKAIKIVQLKNKPGKIGHTWLGTPAGDFGFYPATMLDGSELLAQINGTMESVPGVIGNDAQYVSRGGPVSYKVCPSTLEAIYSVIRAGASGSFQYNAGNQNGGYNCTGFALMALEAGGLRTPTPSGTPGLHPNQIAP